MIYRVGLNDIEPRHWVACVFDLHGCFAKGMTRDEALNLVPAAIEDYSRWLGRHDPGFSVPDEKPIVRLAEEVHSPVQDDYIINALFEDDRRPLTDDDVTSIKKILTYSRADLLELITPLTPERLDRSIPGEVTGSLRGVLNHVATAERWYWDRLDMAFPREDFPEDIFGRLEMVRSYTHRMLPRLIGYVAVHEKRGELWTGRKLARRTLWHEIAHIRQMSRYLSQ